MKKTIFLLLFFAAAFSVKAQLANTKWKGTIPSDQPMDVVFHFGTDTLKVVSIGDASIVEMMTYAAKDGLVTIQKLSGQSDCGASTIGRYKYDIAGSEFTFMLVEDGCEQRGAILNNSKWTKTE